MNDGYPSARVLEIVFVIFSRQQRIHHRDHRANARRAKPRPNKLGTIRQDNENPVFDFNAELAQCVADAIRHARGVAVGVGLIFVIETDFVFATFLHIVVEEVVRHVEVFGRWDSGARSHYSALQLNSDSLLANGQPEAPCLESR